MQNAPFDERRDASSLSGAVQWRMTRSVLATEHSLVVGADASRGRWRDTRTRNSCLTWRPHSVGDAGVNPVNAATWQAAASDWGGESPLESEVCSTALFAHDYSA